MEYAISALSELPENTEQLNKFCEQAKEEILNGVFDARKICVLRTMLKGIIEGVFEDKKIKDFIEEEMMKHNNKSSWGEYEIQALNKKSYDFSSCNDSSLNEIIDALKYYSFRLTEREKYLKGLKREFINEDTGEIIFPPVYTETSYFTVKKVKW